MPTTYTGNRYPDWPHNGKECTILKRVTADDGKRIVQGHGGAWVVFEGDPAHYLVNITDLTEVGGQ